MIKRTAEKSYVNSRINGNKWLLLCCSACAAIVDIVIIALLFIGGTGGEYLACPFILLALDLIYMAVSLFFTNFRFKYSLSVWISYVALFTVGLAIGIAILFGGEGTVLTNTAVGLWAFVHIFAIVCAIVCALHASRILKKGTLAFAVAAIFFAGCACYVGYAFTEGFFGQGFGNRVIVYALNDGGESYSAESILYGNGDTVEIPYTFNGKPVTKVGLNIFANESVKKIILHDDVEFTNNNALANSDFKDKTIHADKEIVNSVRDKLFAYGANNQVTDSAVNLANSVIPAQLDEDEGYIAFNYPSEAYKTYADKIIPVYLGKLDEFDFASYTQGYDYVSHRESGSVSDYSWAYLNGGYILSDVAGEKGSVINGKVTESTVAQVKFEKVFRVIVESGNDTKYDLHEKQPELCFDKLDGYNVAYKFMTEKTAKGFTDKLIPRKGFSCEWRYKSGLNEGAFTDLPRVLKSLDGNDVTLSTEWSLNAPKVTANVSALKITYGENVSFTSSAEIEADGVTLEYGWKLNNETQERWTESSFNLTRPKPAEYGG
ncbi:MAG: hypothetical protein K2O67_03590, partial [Clostridia bacterium]|nr:hypothetical protein [Clostridia bacterium]